MRRVPHKGRRETGGCEQEGEGGGGEEGKKGGGGQVVAGTELLQDQPNSAHRRLPLME